MSFKSQLQIITLVLFFFSSICSSQSKLNLSNDLKVDIISNSYIYKTEQAYPIDVIDSLLKTNQLVRVPSKSSQGFSQEIFWIHFQLLKSELPLIIELDNPHLNNIKLYQKSTSSYELIGSGGDSGQSFKERSYNNRRFIFLINNSQFTREYILMIDGVNSEVHFPLWLWNKEVFEQKESKANVYYGLFFGMLFFISFLSLITSLAVRKKIFLYYGLYALFLGLYLFTYLGFSFQYIYPEAKTFNNYTRFPTIVLFVISLILFLQKFLEIKKNLPKLYRYYSIVIGVFLFNLMGWLIFTDYYVANAYQWLNLLYGFIFTVLITSFYAAYKLYKLQPSRTILFYIAFSFVFVGILLFVISQYGIIQEAIFPINPIIIGVGIEALVLSIAMVLILKKMLQTKEVLEEVKTTLASENEELHKALKTRTIRLKSKAVLNVNDIVYVKSDGHYMEFYLEEKQNPEIDRSTVNTVLELLPTSNFIRVHKSFIVNIDKIKIINSNQLMLTNGTWLKLSRTYKQGLKDVLNKK